MVRQYIIFVDACEGYAPLVEEEYPPAVRETFFIINIFKKKFSLYAKLTVETYF